MPYERILLASDLSEETQELLAKAKGVTGGTPEIHVAHVIQAMSNPHGSEILMDFSSVQEQIHDRAKKELDAICNKAGIPEDHRHLLMGRPDLSISRLIREIDADLIIAGSHKRAGLMMLFGSTSSSLLRETHVDALFVYIDPEKNQEES